MENLNIFEMTSPTYRVEKPIRLIEIFGGIGSQAMALRNLGADFEHHRLIEFDKYAIQSYNTIHDTDFPTMDVTKTKGEDLGITDTDKYTYILTYSFPCQDLSLAGKRRGMAKGGTTRSGLLWEVERLLGEVEELPEVLLMENVPQVIGQKNIQDFRQWQYYLEELGYSNFVATLNAKHYGVAQNRDRTFMVSILGDWYYKFPLPMKLDKTIQHYLEEEVEEKFYLNSDKADKLIEQLIEKGQLEEETIIDDTQNFDGVRTYEEYSPSLRSERSGLKTMEVKQVGNIVEEKNFSNPQTGRVYSAEGLSPTINTMQGGGREPKVLTPIKIKQATKKGYIECKPGGVADLSYPTSETRRGRVEGNGDISPTLTTGEPSIHRLESAYRIRKLTPKECWRLMGFSDKDFHKAEEVVSNSQLYKQSGNSIVVDVLEGIFGEML